MGSPVHEAPVVRGCGEVSDNFGSKVCSLTMQLLQESISVS